MDLSIEGTPEAIPPLEWLQRIICRGFCRGVEGGVEGGNKSTTVTSAVRYVLINDGHEHRRTPSPFVTSQ